MGTDAMRGRALIRTASVDDAEVMGRMTVDTMRASFRGMQPDTGYLAHDRPLANLYAKSERNWRRALGELVREADGDERIFITEDELGITGLCMAGPRRLPAEQFGEYRGEVYVLLVRPDQQRHGLGRALVEAAQAFLAGRALMPVVVESLAANAPARAFYERLGARLLGVHTLEEEGRPLPSAVYGWDGPTDVMAAFRPAK